MNNTKPQPPPRKPYRKPELKAVRIRPREILGTNCHNSTNTAPSPCDLAGGCED